MSVITEAQRAAMAKVVSEVMRVMGSARPVVQAAASALFATDAQKAQWTNFESLQKHAEHWRTTQRRWAESGKRDDGTAFAMAMWMQLGRELMDAANVYARLTVDGSIWKVLTDTASATADDVRSGARAVAGAAIPVLGLAAAVVVGLVVLRYGPRG